MVQVSARWERLPGSDPREMQIMKCRLRVRALQLVIVCVAVAAMSTCSRTQSVEAVSPASWDPKAAAAYLDQREVTWMGWQGAARDHGTFCVSCHTAVPYALARPALRRAVGEDGLSVSEQKLLDNVRKRVQMWNEIGPFYSGEGYDGAKPGQSRGTEAVLNALILASHDASSRSTNASTSHSVDGGMGDITRVAFRNMWALQQTEGDDKGAWLWLQFNMEPFEAKDSQYYGAVLAAIAVGSAPGNYGSSPEIQEKLALLRDYLDRNYKTQSMMNRVVLLWASAKLPGLVSPERQRAIIQNVWDEQQSDGGWKLSSLAWPNDWSLHSFVRARWRVDGTRQSNQSDGYATAVSVFALQQAGVSKDDARLRRGLAWLGRNQDKVDGFWPSNSLTKHRDPSSHVGRFMDDAATGYAVLALSADKSR